MKITCFMERRDYTSVSLLIHPTSHRVHVWAEGIDDPSSYEAPAPAPILRKPAATRASHKARQEDGESGCSSAGPGGRLRRLRPPANRGLAVRVAAHRYRRRSQPADDNDAARACRTADALLVNLCTPMSDLQSPGSPAASCVAINTKPWLATSAQCSLGLSSSPLGGLF